MMTPVFKFWTIHRDQLDGFGLQLGEPGSSHCISAVLQTIYHGVVYLRLFNPHCH